MRTIQTILLLLTGGALLLSLSSCDDRSGMTVESAYVEPLLPEPSYRFARLDKTSVDYREISFISEGISSVYRYMSRAQMSFEAIYRNALGYYESGYYSGYSPRDAAARSYAHSAGRESLQRDLLGLFNESARLSGFAIDGVGYERNTPAVRDTPGYIGASIGDRC